MVPPAQDNWLGRRVWAAPFPYKDKHGMLAITFDDGPDPRLTPLILEVLKKHGVCAAFFMLGSKIQADEELTTRVALAGHQVANHTYSHCDSLETREADWKQEAVHTKQLIGNRDQGRLYLRFPFGSAGREQMTWLNSLTFAEQRYISVGWHIDSLDWAVQQVKAATSSKDRWEKQIFLTETQQRLTSFASRASAAGTGQAHPFVFSYVDWVQFHARQCKGGVLLMHDTVPATAESLDRILSYLANPTDYWDSLAVATRVKYQAYYQSREVDPEIRFSFASICDM